MAYYSRPEHEHIKYVIERSCISKKSFSKEPADRVVDYLARKKEEMYYYKCDFCSSYHLTSKEPNVPKVVRVI